MNTPLPHHLPAQSGAVTGHVMTDEEILDMDRRIVWSRIVRPMQVTLPAPVPAFMGVSRVIGVEPVGRPH